MNKATILFATTTALALASSTAFAIAIDGTLDAEYGLARSNQTTQTQFGDSNLGQPAFANGSELDAAYVAFDATNMYVFLQGNLESNYNKLEIFFDTVPGGQNRLRGDNADVDFNGLNRMSDLNFDEGFEADYYLMLTGGDTGGGDYKMFGNFATLPTLGGGAGTFLGGTDELVYNAGPNPQGIEFTINNMNTAGVGAGCGPAAANQPATTQGFAATGVEIKIPLATLGAPTDCIKITAFVNGGSHDFVSNQSLAPLAPGTCNLGEPHAVDFRAQAGDQFFQVCDSPTPARASTWGRVKTLYR